MWVGRETYLDLWRRYGELLAAYRALEADHQAVLEDHEGLLYDMEQTLQIPVSRPASRAVPSWARTEEMPVVEAPQPGLDPSQTDALIRRGDMLRSPSGRWRVGPDQNG